MKRRGRASGSSRKAVLPKARKASMVRVSTDQMQEQLGRAMRERDEAREQQAATADVLKIISRPTFGLQVVLDTLVQSAAQLCAANDTAIFLREGEQLRVAAHHGAIPITVGMSRPLGRGFVGGRSVLDRAVVHVADLAAAGDEFPLGKEIAQQYGHRTTLGVPLLVEDKAIGCLLVRRTVVEPFAKNQIALLQTFAAQAVIAIENTRLLNELRQRTDDLSESLEQQTATSDVLKVIGRSVFDLQPVFESVAESAVRLCGADRAFIFRFDGETLRSVVAFNAPPDLERFIRETPILPGRYSAAARAALERQTIHIPDVMIDPEYTFKSKDIAPLRTVLTVPILKGDELLGVILVYRLEVRPFTEKQIALVETFADQAAIAIENVRLFNETKEALEQQTATSEVLSVISSSAGELRPVFETMLAKGVALCDASFGAMWLIEGDGYRTAALHGDLPEAYVEQWRSGTLHRPKAVVPMARAIRSRKPVHVPDMRKEKAYLEGDPLAVSAADVAGIRTLVTVPMLKEGDAIGVITIYRKEVRPFAKKQIELVSNFAAQAVIAIENTRLLSELRESLQQQTATADVLKVISRSTFDLQTVLNTLAESAAQLCEAYDSIIFLPQGKTLRVSAHHGPIPIAEEVPIERGQVTGRAFIDRTSVHINDLQAAAHEFPGGSKAALRLGHRTILAVPLLRQGEAMGVLAIRRTEVKPFTDKQIELVRTFADQAVIAIENVRLFDEVQTRTRELTESLEQQTATSEVLKVISSSPGQLEPVFQAMLENAVRICEASFGVLFRNEDGAMRAAAMVGVPPAFAEFWQRGPQRPGPRTAFGRVSETKQTIHIADVKAEPAYADGEPVFVAAVNLGNFRTLLNVPMLKENELIGVLAIYRQEVRPFTEKQIELVQNFAAQAVIAIENTRLLGELRESLKQQTATADVLKVISRSTFDLGTVLQTLVESAARLCDADKTNITRQKDGVFFRAEAFGFSAEFMDYVRNIPIQPDRGSGFGRALLERRAVHIPDVKADPEYTLAEGQKLGDYRTVLAIPMLREGMVIGVLSLTRSEVRPFSEKQIELATTFADQAAIAIENVRLFDSVEARTRELTKSLEELRTTQDRLVQTQKLASLGQLTAGIAHEIKNPLNFVNNFSGVSAELIDELQDALRGLTIDQKARAEITELTDTLRGNLDKVVQHGKRADAIVKNMLLHSREGSGEHRVVDINALVEESLNLAYHGARAEKQGFNITMERSLDPTAGEIDVFPQDITRVLLNLIANGFYAATKRKTEAGNDGYEPTLSASTRSLGDQVEIRIRDNGAGIPPEVREKMFNPFFTTKPAGEGTGLGLSISHDIIVKQHGGAIEVDTEPGEYTEFRIVLPRK